MDRVTLRIELMRELMNLIDVKNVSFIPETFTNECLKMSYLISFQSGEMKEGCLKRYLTIRDVQNHRATVVQLIFKGDKVLLLRSNNIDFRDLANWLKPIFGELKANTTFMGRDCIDELRLG